MLFSKCASSLGSLVSGLWSSSSNSNSKLSSRPKNVFVPAGNVHKFSHSGTFSTTVKASPYSLPKTVSSHTDHLFPPEPLQSKPHQKQAVQNDFAHRRDTDQISGVSIRRSQVSPEDREKNISTVNAIILAGGYNPNAVTLSRCMGAAEFSGTQLQIVDMVISNIKSAFVNKMYVITQFNSTTMNWHLLHGYPCCEAGNPDLMAFVDVLTAEQTPETARRLNYWYKGSADAIRRNLQKIMVPHRGGPTPTDFLITSAVGLHELNFADLLRSHRESGADVTMATVSVDLEQAVKSGVVKVLPGGRVEAFTEKPTDYQGIQQFVWGSEHCTCDRPFESSMGLYVFKAESLQWLLRVNEKLFEADGGKDIHLGRDVIPHAIRDNFNVRSYHYEGYWKEVNSVRDLYDVGIAMTQPKAPLSTITAEKDLFQGSTTSLPPAIYHKADVWESVIADGCALFDCVIKRSLLGRNTYVGPGCTLESVVVIGGELHFNDRMRRELAAQGLPIYGIGEGTYIRNAIVDTNASVGKYCIIDNTRAIWYEDRAKTHGYMIEGGVIVIVAGAVIPDGTVIPYIPENEYKSDIKTFNPKTKSEINPFPEGLSKTNSGPRSTTKSKYETKSRSDTKSRSETETKTQSDIKSFNPFPKGAPKKKVASARRSQLVSSATDLYV